MMLPLSARIKAVGEGVFKVIVMKSRTITAVFKGFGGGCKTRGFREFRSDREMQYLLNTVVLRIRCGCANHSNDPSACASGRQECAGSVYVQIDGLILYGMKMD